MKRYWVAVLPALIALSSCKVVGGIFKAGFWSGIILVFAVLFLIVYLIVKARKN